MNDDNKEKYQAHRYFVLSRLPKLDNLDNTLVSAEERAHVASKKVSDFQPVPVVGSSSIVLSSLNKDVAGFQVSKEGEFTVLGDLSAPQAEEGEMDYFEWDPIYAKVGEGKLLLFNDTKTSRPEAVITLSGYEVIVVEETDILSKIAPGLEVLELRHSSKPKVHLAFKDKQSLAEWLPVLVAETVETSSEKDWDELERQRERMVLMQESLAERSTQIRLKRAMDQSYKIEASEVNLVRVLGHGGFGTVYHAGVRGKSVACKVFHNQNLSVEALDDFCNEMEILSKIHHPHVINFIGACREPLMIVTELMTGGDLEKLLLDVTGYPLSLLTRLSMAKDAALGMAWLHGSDPMIIHRDVKTANFLVDENLRVVVADFGLSDKLRRGASTWDDDGYKGTIYYTAPEILKNAVFNEKSDVYSFGIVLWQILTRQELYPEFRKVHSNDLERAVLDSIVFRGHRPPLPEDANPPETPKIPGQVTSDNAGHNATFCPMSFRRLIEDCWSADPASRPSFDQIVHRIDQSIYELAIPNNRARELWNEWFPGAQQVRWKSFWEHFVLVCTPPSPTELAGSGLQPRFSSPPRTPIKRSVTDIPVSTTTTAPSTPQSPLVGLTPAMAASSSQNNLAVNAGGAGLKGSNSSVGGGGGGVGGGGGNLASSTGSAGSSISLAAQSMLNDLPLKLLIHELVAPNRDMVLHQVNSDVVHIDQFGNFAQWFGPFGYYGHNPAQYAMSVAKNKWFFGEVTINQAFCILNGQESGTFLVRYSLSRRGDYSVSFVTPSGAIAHQHIDRRVIIDDRKSPEKPVSIRYVIPATGQAYDTLFDLIDDQPYLRNRAYGWPFAWIFANRLSSEDIDDSFLDTALDVELQTLRTPRKL